MSDNLEKLIQACDLSLFRIPTQTSNDDRRSLLDVQNLIRLRDPSYTYLEIGSHLGGTLVPHLADPRCQAVISIDPRPLSQPDERGRAFDYEGNSTARMLATLGRHMSRGEILKLRTYDIDASELIRESVGVRFRLALIDGEHTNRAAFKDFTAIYPFMKKSAVVCFHDSNLIFDALTNIEEMLNLIGRRFRSFFLPTSVYAIAFGDMIESAEQGLGRLAFDREEFIKRSRSALWEEIVKHRQLRQAG